MNGDLWNIINQYTVFDFSVFFSVGFLKAGSLPRDSWVNFFAFDSLGWSGDVFCFGVM